MGKKKLAKIITSFNKQSICLHLWGKKTENSVLLSWTSRLGDVINYLETIEDVIDQSPSSAQLSPGALWPLKIILFTG